MLADWACTSAISGSATNTVAAGRGKRMTRPLLTSSARLALGREGLGLLGGGGAGEHAYEETRQHGGQMRQSAGQQGRAPDAK